MPRKAATFELVLDKVDVGWIDMHFKINGEETLMIIASSVYEPFEDIRDWLEQMVTSIHVSLSGRSIRQSLNMLNNGSRIRIL